MDKNDEVTPFALRSVEVTFNNKTKANLYLKGTEIFHGKFVSGPPEIIGAGSSGTWRTKGIFLAGTEAMAYYGVEGSNVELELYWNNPLTGTNSYSASVKHNDGTYTILADGTSGNDSSVDFNVYMKKNWEYNSWMKDIDDKKSIALLSVPGTHQTCATYSPEGDILGVVICQDQSVTEQLQKGIRFLDIRCRAIDGVFTIHHGPIYQKINFGAVLNKCIRFLTSNPSETIFMRIKQEYSEVSNSEFIRIFNEKYRPYHGYMYLASSIPPLSQVRRRIVVLSNVKGLPGIPWNTMQIQDNYNPESTDVKAVAISRHLDFTIENHSNGGDHIFINFISMQGKPTNITIKQAAQKLNRKFVNMLNEKEGKGVSKAGIGMIAMDFPNHFNHVVDEIIKINF